VSVGADGRRRGLQGFRGMAVRPQSALDAAAHGHARPRGAQRADGGARRAEAGGGRPRAGAIEPPSARPHDRPLPKPRSRMGQRHAPPCGACPRSRSAQPPKAAPMRCWLASPRYALLLRAPCLLAAGPRGLLPAIAGGGRRSSAQLTSLSVWLQEKEKARQPRAVTEERLMRRDARQAAASAHLRIPRVFRTQDARRQDPTLLIQICFRFDAARDSSNARRAHLPRR